MGREGGPELLRQPPAIRMSGWVPPGQRVADAEDPERGSVGSGSHGLLRNWNLYNRFGVSVSSDSAKTRKRRGMALDVDGRKSLVMAVRNKAEVEWRQGHVTVGRRETR